MGYPGLRTARSGWLGWGEWGARPVPFKLKPVPFKLIHSQRQMISMLNAKLFTC